MNLHFRLTGAALVGLLVILTPTRAATLEADYQLQGTYASSAGTIGDLSPVGDASGLSFDTTTVNGHSQQVLNVQSTDTGSAGTAGVQAQTGPGFGITSDDYSVVLLADFDLEPTDLVATKILDFKNLSSDAGLYVTALTGTLEFIDGSGVIQGQGLTTIPTTQYVQIALTRNSANDLTSVYENGALAFSFTDSSGLATLGDATNTGNAFLTLFKDDGAGLGGSVLNESTEGDLARLRIFDGVLTAEEIAGLDTVVPEPSTWALLVLGGVVLCGGRRLMRRPPLV